MNARKAVGALFPALTCLALAAPASAGASNATPDVANANTAFAIALYHQLGGDDGNLFFSPYSMFSILAMAAEGTRGETAAEMGEVLHFPEAVRRTGEDAAVTPWRMSPIHEGLARLNTELSGNNGAAERGIRKEISTLREAFRAAQSRSEGLREQRKWGAYREAAKAEKAVAAELNRALAQVDQYELRIANALPGEKTYPFRDAYIRKIAEHYGTGGVFAADFKNRFAAERVRINDWVSEQTRERILDIIPELPEDQARLVRLILTNAIYFKGEWQEPFSEADTELRDFLRADGSKLRVPIMSARGIGSGRYAAFNGDGSSFDTPRQIRQGQQSGLYPDADGFALLELPYKGEELAMVLIAPNAPGGLADIEERLTAERLNEWIDSLEGREVQVLLPKLKLENSYEMSGPLKRMGMVRAFTNPLEPDGAGFMAMCSSDDPMHRLYITMVLHKAFVEVNEKGTEAAAATAVLMAVGASMPVSVPFTPTFKADRPFLFLIRAKTTGGVLFMGRVVDPTG